MSNTHHAIMPIHDPLAFKFIFGEAEHGADASHSDKSDPAITGLK
jgi:hypothetical protein